MAKIRTLKRWPARTLPKKGVVIAAQHISAFQVKDKDFYQEVAIPLRGAVASATSPIVFDIATNPKCAKNVRHGLLALLREKLLNDVVAANEMLIQMEKRGYAKGKKIGLEEISEFLIEKSDARVID